MYRIWRWREVLGFVKDDKVELSNEFGIEASRHIPNTKTGGPGQAQLYSFQWAFKMTEYHPSPLLKQEGDFKRPSCFRRGWWWSV